MRRADVKRIERYRGYIDAGMSAEEISELEHKAVSSVYSYLYRHGMTIGNRPRRRGRCDDIVVAALKAGMPKNKIAELVGMTRSNLWHYIRSHGLEKHVREESRYMTDGEIRAMYRDAADKKQQIRILAQLNNMKIADIRKILEVAECGDAKKTEM